ncbi:MAG: beta-lactamase family protein [Planctomycetes bacterium]|nr:beta-lactamase family protein [Planctomycetota bacterium]
MKLRLILTLLVGLVLTTTAPAQQQLPPNLLELCEKLEAKRQEYHIPGMALVVVHNDQVILRRAFGVSDVDAGARVEPDTLFAIGSSTKSFTSAAVGMLVDEGKMNWDDPASKHLPGFELAIDADDVGTKVLIRDLLSHRTGFPRMSVLFASGKVGRDQILQAVAKAKPWKPFRQNFYYNNVQFLAAGQALGAAAGSSWDKFIPQRILQPLGMKNTYVSVAGAEKSGKMSKGYIWQHDRAELKLLPYRDLDNIAPAGAINSNVIDMSQWLKLLLNEGKYNGKQLISKEALQECWKPQITIGEGIGYGMGWMLREWEGRQVMEHGGNIDGFSSSVALIPEENLGFVLFYNLSISPLQSECLPMVWSAVLDPPAKEKAGAAEADFTPYLGKYVADFGSFNDQRFTVQVKDGSLAVDVPGQMVYELKSPNEEGKWYFAITDTIAVSFDLNDEGKADVMHMFQGGLDLEFPREGVEIVGELPIGELKPFFGRYFYEAGDHHWTVLMKNSRLAVDVPGEMVYELVPPDEEGKWAFRAIRETLQVSFQLNDKGIPTSMTLHKSGTETIMPRAEGEEKEDVTTLAMVFEKMNLEGRQKAFDKAKAVQIHFNGMVEQSGVSLTGTEYHDGKGRMRHQIDFGKYGQVCTTLTAEEGWVASDFGPFELLSANKRMEALEGSAYLAMVDFRTMFDKVLLEGDGVHEDMPYWKLSLHRADHPPLTAYVEQSTGDIRRVEIFNTIEGAGGIPGVVNFSDYRLVQGLRVPHQSSVENEAGGRSSMTIQKVVTGVPLDASHFVNPEPK